FRAAAGWINLSQHASGGIARATVPRFVTLSRIRALRAAILADFATKMDAAASRLTDTELLAAIRRLADERDAALRALERLNMRDRMGRPRTMRRRPRRRYAVRRRSVRSRESLR